MNHKKKLTSKFKKFYFSKDTVNKMKSQSWVSLVAQWLRTRLPTQGTPVRALVQEDPTWHGATKPRRHNY